MGSPEGLASYDAVTESIAHRGVHDVFAENSPDAFQRALDLGFTGIELDVHVTQDGVCVVNHDDAIATPDLSLAIRRTGFKTLQAAAPGLPRLENVLELVANRAQVYVDLKTSGVEHDLARVIRRSRAEVSVHAFDHTAVLRIGRLLPQLRTGILQTSRLVDSVSALRAAKATDLWQWHEFVDRVLVQQVAAANGRVIAWTTNTPADWRTFQEIGVAGLCTDLPDAPALVSSNSSSSRGSNLDALN